jgi:hypothetical protein
MKSFKVGGLGVVLALSMVAIQSSLSEAQLPPAPVPVKPDVPYVPTPESVVMAMLELAKVNRNDVIYDLGSGDGRLVITATQKFGAKKGVGVEINPGLVNRSIENAKQAGVSDRTQFIQQDLFKTDFREASVVTLYLLPKINLELRPKLLSELKPGSRVVSHAFSMGDWKPDRTVKVNDRTAYLWIIPANLSGTWTGTLSTQSGQPRPYKFEVKQTYQNVRATVNIGGETMSLPQVKLVGDQLLVEHSQTLNGQPMRLKVEGQVVGNTLQGTAEVQQGTSTSLYNLRATRSSPNAGP